MINHFHQVEKTHAFGQGLRLFPPQGDEPASPYLRGVSDEFVIPVSRWTEMKQARINAADGLTTLIASPRSGPCLVEDRAHRRSTFNHFEYDSDTLKQDYEPRHGRAARRLPRAGELLPRR